MKKDAARITAQAIDGLETPDAVWALLQYAQEHGAKDEELAPLRQLRGKLQEIEQANEEIKQLKVEAKCLRADARGAFFGVLNPDMLSGAAETTTIRSVTMTRPRAES